MKLLLYFVLLIFPFSVFANENDNTGTISGTVLTADGQPAANVTVLVKNIGKGTLTDEDGNFEIKKIKPGSYILHVSLLGYSDSEISVEVKQNERVFLKIQLQATYAALKKVIVETSLHPNYVETKTSESLRLNLPLIEVPQNIAITSHQLMSDQGLLSMTEAIRTVSGVVKTSGGLNDYSLIMRGTDVPWYSIFRNGIGGYGWNQQEDAAMLEKIEFIKGPAGFMTAVGEPGGVINNVTKQPVTERIASINADFGSYNLMRLTADFGGALSKNRKFYYRFNAGLQDQERAFQFGKALRYFVCPVVTYDINTKTSVTAEYNYIWGKTSGNNDALPSVGGKIFALPRDFAVADAITDQLTVADNYYRIHLKHDFDNNWHLNVQFAYVYGKWGGYRIAASGDMPVSNDTLYRDAYFNDRHNFAKVAQAFVDGKFYTGKKIEHKVLFGFEYQDWGGTDSIGGTWGEKRYGLYLPRPDYYISTDSLKNFNIGYPLKFRAKAVTFYLQDNIKIARKLIVTVGGRFLDGYLYLPNFDVPDYQQKTWYNVFTPRGGLTWLFKDYISVYGLYDQCYHAQTAPNFEQKPLKPLTGYNIEAGMKGFFLSKKLSLNFSLYHNVKNNIITSDPLHVGFYIQTGQIVSKGIDFDLTGNITKWLVANATYEYADAKITKDSDSSLVGIKNFGTPDHSVNLWLKCNLQDLKLKGVSFAIGYQYMGKRSAVWYYNPDANTRFLPAYNLLDAALSYSNEKFNISLNAYNITNVNYAALGYFNSAINEWRYTPGESVNFRLSIGVNLVRHKTKNR